MTLLRFLRNKFSDEQIIKLLRDKRLPNNWSPNSCMNFIHTMLEDYSTTSKRIEDFCEDIKAEMEMEICHDCEEYEHYTDMQSCYEGDWLVCEVCAGNNYRWSDYRDTLVSLEDYDDEDDYDDGYQNDDGAYEYNHNVANDLGFKRLSHEKHSKDTIYYGIELEVERRKCCPSGMPYYITDEVLHGFAQVKMDGSLDNGFEICTTPATYGRQKVEWERFFKDKKCMESLKGWSTDTAGLHIHISRSALRPTDIGKILVFINDDTNNSFISEIAGRSSEQWAKRSPKKVSDFAQHTDKYEAINLSHRATVELRIFRSNVSKHGFYRVLEFTDALVHFAKNYTGLTGMSLHYKTFLRFMDNAQIKAQYPNLSAWLIRKGYINGRPSRQVSWQGEINDTVTN